MKKYGPCQAYLEEVSKNKDYHPCSSQRIKSEEYNNIIKYSDAKEWKKAVAKDKKKRDSIARALGKIK